MGRGVGGEKNCSVKWGCLQAKNIWWARSEGFKTQWRLLVWGSVMEKGVDGKV